MESRHFSARLALLLLAACIGIGLWAKTLSGQGKAPGPTTQKGVAAQPTPLSPPAGREIATLAGGCFWALQTEFEELRGVDKVVAGYAGGRVAHPSYEQVCTETTGHAESIQIVFDPKTISYADLLRIFFTDIDPTTRNQQGNDTGEQYRSVVFYHNAAQRATAEKIIQEITARKLYHDPIVTQVAPYKNFYAAEDYHQNYFAHNPNDSYCVGVVAPELQRFREMNRLRLKR